MKKIGVLLNGSISNDQRVIKIISTISKLNKVDLFYVNGNENDYMLFKNNVRLFNVKTKNTLIKKLIKNSLFFFEYNFFIKQVLNQNINYDYIIANDLPTLFPSMKISKKINSKLIYDSHEIFVETLNQFFPQNSNFPKSIFFKISLLFMRISGRFAEKILFKNVDLLITVNDSIESYFKKKFKIKKSIVVMNFPHKGFINNEKPVNFIDKFNWNKDSKILIYQGLLNEGRGLKLLIKSLKNANHKFKLIILGYGILKKELTELIKLTKQEDRIKLIDKVPYNQLSNYTKGAHIGVNLLENFNLSKKLASPNKLFEYIHAKIPVICSNSLENEKIVKKYNVGILTNNNEKDLISKLNLFLSDDKYLKIDFDKAKNDLCWEKQEQFIINTINEL